MLKRELRGAGRVLGRDSFALVEQMWKGAKWGVSDSELRCDISAVGSASVS